MTTKVTSLMVLLMLLLMPLAGCLDNGDDSSSDTDSDDDSTGGQDTGDNNTGDNNTGDNNTGGSDSANITGIEGCTDSNAANYNADATVDDGSCMDLLPKTALMTLYESWGAHMYTPILDEDDSRVGVELTVTTTEEIMYPEDLKDDSQSGRDAAESQTSWEGTRTSIVRDVPNLSPHTLKDDSGAYVITSVISDGAVLRYADNTTNESSDEQIKQSVRIGDDVVVRTSGVGGRVLNDGTYVRDNHDTRTTDSRSIMEFIIEEAKPNRAPTCVEYYGPESCGSWPACYEPVPGTDCSGQSTTDMKGGGSGWAVGMYEYQACELDGGTWVNTDPDPVANPNVGYCIWSIAPLDDIFGTSPVADGFDFLDAKLADADIDYSAGSEDDSQIWSREGGLITFTFNFASEQVGFKITLTADNHRLAAFSSISVSDSADGTTTTTEVYEMNYLITHEDMEDGEVITAMTRAAPDGTTGHPWLDIRDDFGYYHYCPCSCAPAGGLYVWMLWLTSANNVPIVCMNACFSLCGNSGGSGDHPYLDAKFRTDGVKSGSIGDDVYDIIEGTSMAPPSLSLEFECYAGAEDKSQTVSLAHIRDGTEDCSTTADEDFDTESGVEFVVSSDQVRDPDINTMGVQFMSASQSGLVVEEFISFVASEESEPTEARSEDSGEDDESAEIVRSVVYHDLDEDGKVSPGDRITLTFPHNELIQFVDNATDSTLAIHGDDDTTGVIYRDMSCEEQHGPDVCESTYRWYDHSLGAWVDLRICFLRPSGEDCNGTPISDS